MKLSANDHKISRDLNKRLILLCDKKNIPYHIFTEHYNEPHRYYHNWSHITDLLIKAHKKDILSDDLMLAIAFHDIIYNPKSLNNEENSADLLLEYYRNDDIINAILETKSHNPTTKLSEQLCELDLEILNSPLDIFADYDRKIFREFQFVDYSMYKEKRIEVLSKLPIKPSNLDYAKMKEYTIGIYPGSFNPFHAGHRDILEQAEQIFDKVIIAIGNNQNKNSEREALASYLNFHQVDKFDGLFVNYLKKKPYNFTVVHGLRNSRDYEYQIDNLNINCKLYKNLKTIYLQSKPEFLDVSSSFIKYLRTQAESEDDKNLLKSMQI